MNPRPQHPDSVRHAVTCLREERRRLVEALTLISADPMASGGLDEADRMLREINREIAEVLYALEVLSAGAVRSAAAA